MSMPPKMEAIFETVFSEAGYFLDDYHVDVMVLSETNQLIIVCDHKEQRHVKIPVEQNVLAWSWEHLANVVVEGLQQADMDSKGYV